MAQIKAYGKRILTLTAESELIMHEEQFRDSRRGNAALIKRMKWLKRLNSHHLDWIFKANSTITTMPKLKVTITKN